MITKPNQAIIHTVGLLTGMLFCAGCMLASIRFGFLTVSWNDVWASIAKYDSAINEQIVVRTTRLPRAFIAAAVGASLAVAGAIMQAVTRNPLASPSVMGINAGATLAVVSAITVFSVTHMGTIVWIAFGGAAVAAAFVYLLGSLGRDGLTPLKIILAGSAMTALFVSFTQGLLVRNENGLQDVLFWLTGSIAGREQSMLMAVIPYMSIAWLGALLLSKQLNILAMGEEAAKGLGQRTTAVTLLSGFLVVMLAGGSVAVAGPIGFIGIVIPHIVRGITGLDYRLLIPYSALLGAILLLLADVAARFIIMPEEMPVGIMMAVIGAPFFIYIARKELRSL
ncbi:iron complex transport system permease protein [Paenibacillus phyllosphaerae]|uniref:Iron complex transport system permease protein n=1 Tax=Paenibacillus phyllosphaerae TaxID=274593 RepID=A0A7W5B0L4_9BACL|nr:iron ABC transporter permease [Paenibacillus phyllosphaerae]MBB3111706.1 iron complex transport system permease protein [Paenibacillus phyllosphaerae]